MTDTKAPERIRASMTAVRDGWYQVVNLKGGQREFPITGYVRADLHAAQSARIDALEAALRDIESTHIPSEPMGWVGTELDWAYRQYGRLRGIARTALNDKTPTDTGYQS